MKKQGASKKGFGTKARIALVAVCGGALLIAMALPAMAAPMEVAHQADIHESVIQHEHISEQAVQQAVDQDGDDSQLGDQPGDENIVDQPEPQVEPPEELEPPTDGGDEEIVPPDSPPRSENPSITVEPTPTPHPNKPEGHTHRSQLAYTGGNATPYLVIGTLIALAGTGLLLKTVLANKSK